MRTIQEIDLAIDEQFQGRLFEVYSIASGESMSDATPLSKALDELDAICETNGAGNGVDVREVK